MLRFSYRLALALGIADVQAMLRSMTWQQFLGWHAYYALEPFGELRGDLRIATAFFKLAKLQFTKNETTMQFSDFMPDFEAAAKRAEPPKPITREQWAESKRRAIAYAKAQ